MITHSLVAGIFLAIGILIIKRAPKSIPVLLSSMGFGFLGVCIAVVVFWFGVGSLTMDYETTQFNGQQFIMLPRPLWVQFWLAIPAELRFWSPLAIFFFLGSYFGYTHQPNRTSTP